MKHDLGHQLRCAVRRNRNGRRILAHGRVTRVAVYGGGRREDEFADTGLDGDVQQCTGIHCVVAVVPERIGDQFRNDNRCREVNDRADAMVSDDFADQRPIARAAGNEGNGCRDQEPETGRQIVEHDDGLARVGEFVHHVASDVAGASRHQNCHSVAPCACGNVPADSKNCVLIAPPDGMVMAAILNDRYMSATNAPCPTSFSSRHLRSAM